MNTLVVSRPITSHDPRKKKIVEVMKSVVGCTKITNVRESTEYFHGRAMKKSTVGKHFVFITEIKILKSEIYGDGGAE